MPTTVAPRTGATAGFDSKVDALVANQLPNHQEEVLGLREGESIDLYRRMDHARFPPPELADPVPGYLGVGDEPVTSAMSSGPRTASG